MSALHCGESPSAKEGPPRRWTQADKACQPPNGPHPMPTPSPQVAAADWRTDLADACRAHSIRKVAQMLGYIHSSPVHRALKGRDTRGEAAIRARWLALQASGELEKLRLRLHRVGKRGIRFGRKWIGHPALDRIVGQMVVSRRSGSNALVIFGGPYLDPLCTVSLPREDESLVVATGHALERGRVVNAAAFLPARKGGDQ